MVIEVSKDKNGALLYVRTMDGTSFQTGGTNLCPDQTPRTVAKWKGALDKLVAFNLLEPRGKKGEVFALTVKGYEVADGLQGQT